MELCFLQGWLVNSRHRAYVRTCTEIAPGILRSVLVHWQSFWRNGQLWHTILQTLGCQSCWEDPNGIKKAVSENGFLGWWLCSLSSRSNLLGRLLHLSQSVGLPWLKNKRVFWLLHCFYTEPDMLAKASRDAVEDLIGVATELFMSFNDQRQDSIIQSLEGVRIQGLRFTDPHTHTVWISRAVLLPWNKSLVYA